MTLKVLASPLATFGGRALRIISKMTGAERELEPRRLPDQPADGGNQ